MHQHQGHFQSSKRSAEFADFEEGFSIWARSKPEEKLTEHGIGVGYAVSDMYLIVFVLCIELKGKSEHLAKLKLVDLGSINVSSLEPNIVSVLLPANLFFPEAFFRIYVGFHAPGEETLVLLEVADVDLVLQ